MGSAGNKKDNVTIVYTPWSNLKKDGSMVVGQVGFRDMRKVKRILVDARANAVVNRLNKTKIEKYPDLRQEREDRDKELRLRVRRAMLERVRAICPLCIFHRRCCSNNSPTPYSKRKRLELPMSARRWPGAAITHTTK